MVHESVSDCGGENVGPSYFQRMSQLWAQEDHTNHREVASLAARAHPAAPSS